jgi:NACalpha-BTF3-like transcription factor
MTRQVASTIYLEEQQRKRLFDLARRRKSSLSAEIRSAVDHYLNEGFTPVPEKEAELLVRQANASIDHMVKALDEAHEAVQEALAEARKKERRR